MKKDFFFAKPFSEKRFINISVCQSNIKSKKGTYYGKVCKTGHLSTKQILQLAKDRSPYIDIPMVESALETIADVILDMAAQGYNVDFFNLGTFSLGTSGKIEVSEKAMKKCEEDANYDISNKVKEDVNFAFKFSPSQAVKKSLKNVKMNLAIKKHRAPKIEKIENVLPPTSKKSPAILKIRGDGLKVIGERKEVGIYIEEKQQDNRPNAKHKDTCNNKKVTQIKISREAIIQNENKTLMIVLDEHLKEGKEYYIKIATQGVSGGKQGKEVRMSKIKFILKNKSIYNNNLFLYNQ